MYRFIFYKDNGIIQTIGKVATKDFYTEGEVYGIHQVFYIGDEYDHLSDNEIITKYFLKNGILHDLPERPSQIHEFNLDSESWELLEENMIAFKNSVITNLKKQADSKISVIYPIYKQLNIEADYGRESNEYISMRTYINSIRDLSNEYERSITDSSNEIDIKLLADTFLEKIKTL